MGLDHKGLILVSLSILTEHTCKNVSHAELDREILKEENIFTELPQNLGNDIRRHFPDFSDAFE